MRKELVVSLMWFAAAAAASDAPRAPRDATPDEVSIIRTGMEAQLKDAESAKFKDVRILDPANGHVGLTACGLVNAKNSYGAYSGYSAFQAMIMTGNGGKPYAVPIAIDEEPGGVAAIVCKKQGLL